MSFLKKIAGLLIFILMFTQIAPTYAVFSPKIAQDVAITKSHIRQSRQKHGSGSAREIWNTALVEQKQRAREGKATGGFGDYTLYKDLAKESVQSFVSDSFFDPISYMLGKWFRAGIELNNCLRDDLIEIDELQEAALAETIKSAIKFDRDLAPRLWADYTKMRDWSKSLRDTYKLLGDQSPIAGKENQFYVEGQQDYYVDCPYNDFIQAFEELTKKWENFERALLLDCPTCEWGSLEEMRAEVRNRAKRKARDWITANKISLRIAGSPGTGGTNLLAEEGRAQLEGKLRTELQNAEMFIELARPILALPAYLGVTVATLGEGLAEGAVTVGELIEETFTSQTPEEREKELEKQTCVAYRPDYDVWENCSKEEEKDFEAGLCDLCMDPKERDRTFAAIQGYIERQEKREEQVKRIQQAVTFNFQQNSIGEAEIKHFSDRLQSINFEVLHSIEKKNEAVKGLPNFLERVESFNQCVNHQ